MNDWDVSAVTDFSGMFRDLTTFNESIDKWDVSSGTTFVSNERPKQRTQTFTRLTLFRTWMQSQVNPSPLMCGFGRNKVFSTNRYFASFSLV
jgi:hypothetical protein